MAKIAKDAAAPPKKASGRKSVKQAEVREALELLKSGKGNKVTGDKGKEFLVVELDIDKVQTVKQAEAALFNLRWSLNPKNPESGDEAEFERLFASAGHGGLKVYGDDKRVMLAAISTYPTGKPAAKKSSRPSTAKSTAKATVKKQ